MREGWISVPAFVTVVATLIVATLMIATSAASAAPTTSPTTQSTAMLASDSIEHTTIRRGAAAPATQAVVPAAAPGRSASSSSLDLPRLALSLAIVIVLILLARLAMRKMFPAAAVGRSSQVIRVLSRSVLAPKQQFLLLKVGKRLIVVGDSGTNMSALAEITDPEEVAALVGQLSSESTQSASATFGALFRRASTDFTEKDQTAAATTTDESETNDEPSRPIHSDPKLLAASSEIGSLLEHVRGLAQNMKRS